MANRTHLETLQYWMTEIVMGNGLYGDKVKAVEAHYKMSIKDVILESEIPEARRLWVYEAGFSARLLECLRADYPLLTEFLTDDVFNQLGRAYIYSEKPKSYTLFDLGKGLPEFLKQTIPIENRENLLFVNDLARYEQTFLEVIRAKGMESSYSFNDMASVLMKYVKVEDLKLSPCLKLLMLDFPIRDYVLLSEKERAVYTPVREKQYLAICRKSYKMKVVKLLDWQFYFLQSCEIGNKESTAIEVASMKTNYSQNEIKDRLDAFKEEARTNGLIH